MASFDQPIIKKKARRVAHAHHGGSWKIAYADFVTAMMAFFLLLWLISMASPEQKQGLADYFAPPHISETTSGSGGVMGGTALNESGAQMAGSTADAISVPKPGLKDASVANEDADAGAKFDAVRASQIDVKSQQDQLFHSAAASIRQAWQAMPEIAELSDNLLIEETEEGLNIQIVDQQGEPMFPEGSKYPYEKTRQAIAAIAPVLQQLPNQIRVSGHTAAGGNYANPRYGAWELSSDRANTVRGLLGEFGLSDERVHSVVGRATAEPFFPNNPYLAANERIKITLLYEAPPVPADLEP
jgi:chemotaxis protein MotB